MVVPLCSVRESSGCSAALSPFVISLDYRNVVSRSNSCVQVSDCGFNLQFSHGSAMLSIFSHRSNLFEHLNVNSQCFVEVDRFGHLFYFCVYDFIHSSLLLQPRRDCNIKKNVSIMFM